MSFPSYNELKIEATGKNIKGRSKMTKNDLLFALGYIDVKIESETLFPPMGTLFIHHYYYTSPEIIRTVGDTGKRLLVENVPVISKWWLGGGEHIIDAEWLESNDINRENGLTVFGKPQKDEYGWCFTFNGKTFIQLNEDPKIFKTTSVEY